MWFFVGLIGYSCLAPVFQNQTGSWTEQDSRVFTRSLTRCEEKFRRSPCLEKFYKTANGSFRATCKDPFYFTRHPDPTRKLSILPAP